ncbi:MAG: hypothetical protein OXC05_06875 [Halieaceae bacterium]|nr:hypothetical protein [Halieaceae bacterium]
MSTQTEATRFSATQDAAYVAPERFSQLLLIWSGPVLVAMTMLGMIILAPYVPATDPTANAETIQAFYLDNLWGIRFGMVLCLIAFSLLVPFGVGIALQTRRMETIPAMSWLQVAAIAVCAFEGIMAVLIWLAAAYRPGEVSAEITLTLHDLGWLTFLIDIPIFSIWLAAVGIAILRDRKSPPLLPRWLGYFTLWVAILLAPALGIEFFKTGPFAYNGLLALYLPFVMIFLWMIVIVPPLLKAMDTPR